ncbi:MAG: ferredoxin [Nitrospirae bacterium]|nr:MAG: ferredoxin [Nitrospirota bacterium]
MTKRRIRLTFPQELIKEPVIYTMAKECDVMPNIRRAKITEVAGEVVLELEGKEENIDRAVNFLVEKGVVVEPVEGDVLE